MITPGSTSVDLSVYDAAASVEGISGSADVVRMQTEGSAIEAVELFAIKNDSNPPRTLASAATFEFVLPDGAQIDGARRAGSERTADYRHDEAGEGEESLHFFFCAEARRDSLPDCVSLAL